MLKIRKIIKIIDKKSENTEIIWTIFNKCDKLKLRLHRNYRNFEQALNFRKS